MTILVSACLLGTACRYDGRSKGNEDVLALRQTHTLIPVCAEIMGGLPTPRDPAERCGGRVLTKNGADVTAQYERGAREVLRLAQIYGAQVAVFKERSPSCGSGVIYNGCFDGSLTEGWGVAAALLRDHGILVLGETELSGL